MAGVTDPNDTGDAVRVLLLRAKAGDLAAFDQLMSLHERRVFQTAARLVDYRDDAPDAVQEVFLRFYKHLHRFNEARGCAPWLYRITVNVCRDLNRRRHRTATLSLDDPGAVTAAAEATSESDPAADLARSEEQRFLTAALQRLSEKERTAFVLRDLEGLPTQQVAEILGSTPGTVRSQVCTARLKLQKYREAFLRGNR
jgi:RNA polymerase sigma-70 factor (ECF subfamily)